MKALLVLVLVAALSGCVGDDVDDLKKARDALEARVAELEQQMEDAESFEENLTALLEAPYGEALLIIDFGAQDGIWDNQVLYADIGFLQNETPTEDAYQAAGYARPDVFNGHDLLEYYSETGNTYNGTVGQFGLFLEDINDVAGFHNDNGTGDNFDDDYGAYWQVFVNGRSSMVGLSDLEVDDGMTVKLVYTHYGTPPTPSS